MPEQFVARPRPRPRPRWPSAAATWPQPPLGQRRHRPRCPGRLGSYALGGQRPRQGPVWRVAAKALKTRQKLGPRVAPRLDQRAPQLGLRWGLEAPPCCSPKLNPRAPPGVLRESRTTALDASAPNPARPHTRLAARWFQARGCPSICPAYHCAHCRQRTLGCSMLSNQRHRELLDCPPGPHSGLPPLAQCQAACPRGRYRARVPAAVSPEEDR